MFAVSRLKKGTPIGQGDRDKPDGQGDFFLASTGRSGTDSATRIIHHQAAALTPALWGRQKMQTLLHFPPRGRSRAGFCRGSSHPGSRGVGGGLRDVSCNVESGL